MSTSIDAPCRLFVYLARDAPRGAVLRRGPSGWVRLSLWDLKTDTFEHGQWMHARVYERRCDLSPDGRLFVSFVRGTPDEPAPGRDTWIAVSRPPWFTALALWFVGGTYCTGGMFPTATSLWTGFEAGPPDIGALPKWLANAPMDALQHDRTNDWTDRTVWHNRLRRDGWTRLDGATPETWRRPHPSASLDLDMIVRSSLELYAFGGRYLIEYVVQDQQRNQRHELGIASWADWDHRGRLMLARDGVLSCWDREHGFTVITDFNGQTPDPQSSPPEARRWP